jgi:hypothetical protein
MILYDMSINRFQFCYNILYQESVKIERVFRYKHIYIHTYNNYIMSATTPTTPVTLELVYELLKQHSLEFEHIKTSLNANVMSNVKQAPNRRAPKKGAEVATETTADASTSTTETSTDTKPAEPAETKAKGGKGKGKAAKATTDAKTTEPAEIKPTTVKQQNIRNFFGTHCEANGIPPILRTMLEITEEEIEKVKKEFEGGKVTGIALNKKIAIKVYDDIIKGHLAKCEKLKEYRASIDQVKSQTLTEEPNTDGETNE